MKKIFWLTGLPCSGKTTIAKQLAKHIHAEILDGDDIRELLKNQDFSPEGRKRHMLSIAELASRISKYANVIVALVSPLKDVREEIKSRYPNLIEIFVKCDVDECKKRDVKGMYAQAMKGEIKNFTGVDAPYEEPTENMTVVNTKDTTVEECVNTILEQHYPRKKHSLFIGRWQPLHDGHKTLFDQARKEGRNILIGIRDTGLDESNPFSIQERIDMIREQVPDAEVCIIPDIDEVVYGRKVGYGLREIKLDEATENISATKIREEMGK